MSQFLLVYFDDGELPKQHLPHFVVLEVCLFNPFKLIQKLFLLNCIQNANPEHVGCNVSWGIRSILVQWLNFATEHIKGLFESWFAVLMHITSFQVCCTVSYWY